MQQLLAHPVFLTVAPLSLNARNFLISEPVLSQFVAEEMKMVQVVSDLCSFVTSSYLQNSPQIWAHKCDMGGKLGGQSILTWA